MPRQLRVGHATRFLLYGLVNRATGIKLSVLASYAIFFTLYASRFAETILSFEKFNPVKANDRTRHGRRIYEALWKGILRKAFKIVGSETRDARVGCKEDQKNEARFRWKIDFRCLTLELPFLIGIQTRGTIIVISLVRRR